MEQIFSELEQFEIKKINNISNLKINHKYILLKFEHIKDNNYDCENLNACSHKISSIINTYTQTKKSTTKKKTKTKNTIKYIFNYAKYIGVFKNKIITYLHKYVNKRVDIIFI